MLLTPLEFPSLISISLRSQNITQGYSGPFSDLGRTVLAWSCCVINCSKCHEPQEKDNRVNICYLSASVTHYFLSNRTGC